MTVTEVILLFFNWFFKSILQWPLRQNKKNLFIQPNAFVNTTCKKAANKSSLCKNKKKKVVGGRVCCFRSVGSSVCPSFHSFHILCLLALWLVAKLLTSHYLNLWWLNSTMLYDIPKPQWVNWMHIISNFSAPSDELSGFNAFFRHNQNKNTIID